MWSRNATPVMGSHAAAGGVPNHQLRMRACSAKPPSHVPMSGSLCVKRTFRNAPETTITPGRIQEPTPTRSEEHTSELQSLRHLVCRLLLEKKINKRDPAAPTGRWDTLRLDRAHTTW